jgi:hypothetical protein
VDEDDERREVTWSIGPVEPLPEAAAASTSPLPDDRTPWRATLLASVAALAIAVLALVLTVSTRTNHGLSCPEAWRTFDESTLPEGWTLESSDYNVIGASFTLAAPNDQSGLGSAAPSPFLEVQVLCAGPGTERLFQAQRSAQPTGTAGPTEVDIGNVGERRFAVTGEDRDSLLVQIQRGSLLAQIYVGSEDFDQPDFLAIYRALDEFMKAQ